MPKTVNLKIDYSQKTISNSVIIPWKVYDIVDVIISVLQKCPQGSVDFREEQCGFFNKYRFRGFMYHWTPYKRIYDGNVVPFFVFVSSFTQLN